MSMKDEETSQVPDQLMEQLLKGYDALHVEVKLLNERQQELERKLALATQQVSTPSYILLGPLHEESLLALDL